MKHEKRKASMDRSDRESAVTTVAGRREKQVAGRIDV
jgi:hypothetical protein